MPNDFDGGGSMIRIMDAIFSLVPNAKCSVAGNKIILWESQETQPTEAEIANELARLQSEYDAKEYARKRASEYPSIGDQLDALFHAGVFPSDMAAQIQAIKDKYPKV